MFYRNGQSLKTFYNINPLLVVDLTGKILIQTCKYKIMWQYLQIAVWIYEFLLKD